MSTSENNRKLDVPINHNQRCKECGGIEDKLVNRVSESWVLRQGRCPDCWQDHQDARNDVREESDENQEELQAEDQE